MSRKLKRIYTGLAEPTAEDLSTIPPGSDYMLPLIEKYHAILLDGRAAVHPKRFATRREATSAGTRLVQSMRYYQKNHPELGIAPHRTRVWPSREDGGYRFAMVPRTRGSVDIQRG